MWTLGKISIMKLITLATVFTLISVSSCAHNNGNNQVVPSTPANNNVGNNQAPQAPIKSNKRRRFGINHGQNLQGKFDQVA